MNNRLIGLLAGLVFALSSSVAQAMLITYDFDGNITSNDLGELFPGKSIDDSYSGSFTLDTNAVKIGDFPGVGSSSYAGATMALSLEGTSYVVSRLDVWADNSIVDEGIELLFGPGLGTLSLRSSADIFADTSVPTSLNLADFDATAEVQKFVPDAPGGTDRGAITRLSRVPEPTNLALLGIGLAGMGFARRKQIKAA